jgi:N-acetylneuraminic acid mutarotase
MDTSGNLWLLGGYGYDAIPGGISDLNDLWKYNPTSNEWTWMAGSNQVNATGRYGTQAVAASGNVPGARESSVAWTDASGNFYLFGGQGYDSTGTYGYLNDLWTFTP